MGVSGNRRTEKEQDETNEETGDGFDAVGLLDGEINDGEVHHGFKDVMLWGEEGWREAGGHLKT